MHYHNTNNNLTRSLYGKLHSKTPASAGERKAVNEQWVQDPDMKWETPAVDNGKAALRQDPWENAKPRLIDKNRAIMREAEEQGSRLVWFRILIYVLLFAIAAVSLVNAAIIISGIHYPAELKEQLKAELSYLGTMDIGFAAVYIISALLMVLARFRLAAFRRSAINLLRIATLLTSVSMLAASLSYNFYAKDLLGEMNAIRPSLGFIVPVIIVFLVNEAYLKRRKELFVH